MRIRTFVSAAALGLALGVSTGVASENYPSPNVEGSGLSRSIFDNNPQTGTASPAQQASPPLETGSGIAQGAGADTPQLAQNQDFVRQVQSKLNAAGYDVGAVDGVWGPQSEQALMAYQRDNGLAASGALSTEVANSLQIQPPGEPQAAGLPPATAAPTREGIDAQHPGPSGNSEQ